MNIQKELSCIRFEVLLFNVLINTNAKRNQVCLKDAYSNSLTNAKTNIMIFGTYL